MSDDTRDRIAKEIQLIRLDQGQPLLSAVALENAIDSALEKYTGARKSAANAKRLDELAEEREALRAERERTISPAPPDIGHWMPWESWRSS